MAEWFNKLMRFIRTEDGPTAVEYAVMLSFLIVVCYIAIAAVGGKTCTMFANPVLREGLGGS